MRPLNVEEVSGGRKGVLVSNASVIGDNGGIIFRIMNVNRFKLRFTKCMNYWHSSSISRIAYGRTSNSGRTHVCISRNDFRYDMIKKGGNCPFPDESNGVPTLLNHKNAFLL